MGKGKFMFVLALAMAGLAAWLANAWMQKKASLGTEPAVVKTQSVVIAALPIGYADKIENSHLKVVSWPEEFLPVGYVSDPKKIEGMVALMEMAAGDIVSEKKFSDRLDGSRLAAMVEEGKRAMSVRVDDVIGVAGFILPGNRVDILGVRVNSSDKTSTVRSVVSDVKVLAVDQEVSPGENKAKIVRAVTLEVTSEQSQELVKAMAEGRIHLTLRNPLDRHAVEEPKPTPKPKVIKQAVKAPTPTPVDDSSKVQVIRGTSLIEEKPRD